MAVSIEHLQAGLSNLQLLQTRLIDSLQTASTRLDGEGLLPDPSLADQLHDFHRTARQLAAEMQSAGMWHPAEDERPACPAPAALQAALARFRQHETAIAWLKAVQLLEHRGAEQFTPLEECRSNAAQLQTRLEQPGDSTTPGEEADGDTIAQLVRGVHPLCGLVQLAVNGDRLNDEQWGRLTEQIGEHLGQPLATAAVRGRLTCNGECPPELFADVASPGTGDTTGPAPASTPDPDPAALRPDVETAQSSDSLRATGEAGNADPTLPAADVSDEPVPADKNASAAVQPEEPADAAGSHLSADGLTPAAGASEPATAEPAPPVSEAAEALPEPEQAEPTDSEQALDSDDALTEPDSPENLAATGAVILRNPQGGRRRSGSGDSSTTAGDSGTPGGKDGSPRFITGEVFPERHLRLKRGLRELAGETARARGPQRDGLTSLLVWRLVLEDRLSLAWHLAVCFEARDTGKTTCLPSWLIRSIALGTAVRHPTGAVVRQLTDDLAKFGSEHSATAPDGWDEATTFLRIAATLKASVIAPTTGAPALLHGQKLPEGFSRLRNYCVRAAVFGDRQRKLDPSQFKREQDETAWQQREEELTAEIEAWRSTTLKNTIRYEPAPHCYFRSHWSLTPTRSSKAIGASTAWQLRQETANAADQLLQPISEQDSLTAGAQRVQERLEQAVDRWLSPQPGGTVVPESARQLVDQAVALARGWLNHLDCKPGGRPAPIPRGADDVQDVQQAEQLCRDLHGRHAEVQQELRDYERSHQSLLIAAGIACCCRATESLRQVFDPDIELPAEELDLRPLLHGELLRVPGLPMNERWEPEIDIESLERAIVELLADEEHDWETVFATQCRTGNCETASRILSLPVWDDETRKRLRSMREVCLDERRKELCGLIHETRELIAEARRLRVLEEVDHQRLAGQLDELEEQAARTTRPARLMEQLQRVQQGIIQLRQTELERVRRRIRLLDRGGPPPAPKAPAADAGGEHRSAEPAVHTATRPAPSSGTPPDTEPPRPGGWDMDLFADP